eukprot:6802593-Prymnesium_polylepis.1
MHGADDGTRAALKEQLEQPQLHVQKGETTPQLYQRILPLPEVDNRLAPARPLSRLNRLGRQAINLNADLIADKVCTQPR